MSMTLRKSADWFAAETRLELLDLPEPLFGTSDAMAYTIKTATLEVVDLKYGKGVSVNVENNPQLKIYGLGGLRKVHLEVGQAHRRPAPDGWSSRPKRHPVGERAVGLAS